MKTKGSKREVFYILLVVAYLTVIGINSPAFNEIKRDTVHSSGIVGSTFTEK